MSGIVKSQCNEFNLTTVKILNISLIPSHQERASIIWNPKFNADIIKIEQV